MDVTEHPHDAWPVEADRFRMPGRVAAEIEGLGFRERKNVVIEPVGIWKIDGRAGGDREHVRYERLVALIHHRMAAVAGFERAARCRVEVDDGAQQIWHVASGRRAKFGD